MIKITEGSTRQQHAAAAVEAIEAEEEAFNMHSWIGGSMTHEVEEHGLAPENKPSACNTTLCAAGWLAHNAGYRITAGGMASKGEHTEHVEEVALKLLGDPEGDLSWMFYVGNAAAMFALKELAAGRTPDYDDAHELDDGSVEDDDE